MKDDSIIEIKKYNDEEKMDFILKDSTPIRTIKGKVLDTSTHLTIKDVCIKITDSNFTPLFHCFTNCDGYFEFHNNFPQNIKFIVTKKGYDTYSSDSYFIDDPSLKNLCFVLYSSFKNQRILTGLVIDRCDTPIPFIKVTLLSMENNFKQTTYTNKSGQFIFHQIPKGDYKLQFESFIYYPYTCEITIKNFQSIINIPPIYLKSKPIGSTLHGVIKDPLCNPIEYALVILIAQASKKAIDFTYTNSSGIYLFYHLKPGIYSIMAQK